MVDSNSAQRTARSTQFILCSTNMPVSALPISSATQGAVAECRERENQRAGCGSEHDHPLDPPNLWGSMPRVQYPTTSVVS